MKIMQQLLSKGLLFVIAFIVALAYFKRAELWPQWFAPQTKETHADSAPAPVTEANAPTTLSSSGSKPDAAPETAPADTGGSTSDAAIAPVANVQVDANAPGDSSMQEPAGYMASASPALPPATVSSDAPAAANATDAMSPEVPAPDTATLLQQARSAYWAHDLDTAERLYHQMASLAPDDADPLGELGNLYYSEGRWNDAATAYEGVVQRLMAQGDVERGEYVLTVLDGLDPMRAEKLRKELHAGGGG